jgi:L-ascorbate metabolism protein UlaG (beta-lactamase superfamily)
MKITLLGHSGFAVELDSTLLIFDYYTDEKHIMPALPFGEKNAVFFASHAHHDHFANEPLRWRDEGRCELVVGYDLPASAGGVRMKPGYEADVAGAHVRAFSSTDQGVSFLVESGGVSVFHAGDYNFWHWRAESTEAEVASAERAFEEILDTIRGSRVDVAFFPVDPRMGADCAEGALRFAEAIRPRVLIPMHFWGEDEVARAFARGPIPGGVLAYALTRPGESIDL